MTWVNRQDDRIWVLQIFMFLILFLCFRFLQSLYSFSAHHTQISKSVLSNMMESSESWFEEITRNPTMLEFYTQAFTASTSEWTSSLLFMTKENTRFWASLLILKRELWHLETGKLHFTCCHEALQHKVNMNGRRDRNSQCPTYIEKMIFFE